MGRIQVQTQVAEQLGFGRFNQLQTKRFKHKVFDRRLKKTIRPKFRNVSTVKAQTKTKTNPCREKSTG